MPRLNHRRDLYISMAAIALSLSAILPARGQGGTGDFDVGLVYVNKTQSFQQKGPGTNNVSPKTNPFSLRLGANARVTNGLTSGQFRPPPGTGAFQNLTKDAAGNLYFDGGSFATLAALNTAFPNGSYVFNLVTATAPVNYTATVPITGDAYPSVAPLINSGTWATGGLQVDATQVYNFSWNQAASGTQVFQIVDSSNNVVFTRTLTSSFGTSMPANTLQPGQYYTASLSYQTRQQAFQDTTTTWLATYAVQLDFKIATIGAVPTVTGPSTPLGTVGQMFVYQVIATNHPFSYSASALPAGLTMNSTLGIISGIPTTQGTTPATLSAQNIDGVGTKTNFAITVQPFPKPGPVIVSSTSAQGFAGQPFKFQVVTQGATSAARISATGLPAGLTLDSVTGKIAGTTNAVGSFGVNLTVNDGSFSVPGFLQLTFTGDPGYPVINNADTVLLPKGQPFNYQIATPGATDPNDPVVYSMIGTLPQGLGFDGTTGKIFGTYTGPIAPAMPDSAPGPSAPELAGGALLGSIQLFGTNSHGTSTFQLLFLAQPIGAVNISTRLFVGTGNNVLIGGFIITGNVPKVVIIRAIGPSLGIPGALQDPILELHDSFGNTRINDNWKSDQEQIIRDTTIPPPDDRESAIVIGLDPGPYTAIVSGKNGATGIGLVEVYDLGTASLDSTSKAQLAQISTRGNVLQGDNVMIGGFIISGATTKVIVRGIGPSLQNFGIPNPLLDPTLELFNGSGTSLAFNDDWRTAQEQAIKDTGVPPSDDRESAIVNTLAPGAYTAIVRGKNTATGVALVEVYGLQ